MSLAMIAGFLDAYGIITYDTYVSFMSEIPRKLAIESQGNGCSSAFSAGNRILRGWVLRRSFARAFRGASDTAAGFWSGRSLAGLDRWVHATWVFIGLGSHFGV